jgi:hypothetical protein
VWGGPGVDFVAMAVRRGIPALELPINLSAFRDRGVPKPTSECAACPSPDGSSGWASAKGGGEVAGDGRERGGNLAAFVFVPRPGQASAVGGYKRPRG